MDLLKLKQSIKKYEGLSLKPYLCPKKKLTIGFGHNLESVGITPQIADLMLELDILNTKLELVDKIPFFKNLDDIRQNVLLEMAFNMGVPNLLEFKNTLKFMEKKDFINASIEMLDSQWHRDFQKFDLLDGKKSKQPLRSEYLSKVMYEGVY